MAVRQLDQEFQRDALSKFLKAIPVSGADRSIYRLPYGSELLCGSYFTLKFRNRSTSGVIVPQLASDCTNSALLLSLALIKLDAYSDRS